MRADCSRPGAIALVADRTAAYVSFEHAKRSSSSDTPKIGFLAALARLCPEPLNTPVALGHRFDSINKTYIGAISDNVVPPPSRTCSPIIWGDVAHHREQSLAALFSH